MKRFTELYMELDASNRTTSKLAALKRYFGEVPDADAAWAVYFLTGQRLKRIVKTGDLREWAAEACGYPLWMVEECYGHVGDLAETLALLLASRESQSCSVSASRTQLHDDGRSSTGFAKATPVKSEHATNEHSSGQDVVLHELVENELLPLRDLEVGEQRERIGAIWNNLGSDACFVFNKLITGGFRVGVSKTLVNRALADLADVEPATMAHRLMGDWKPEASRYRALLQPDSAEEDSSRPYPFCLAYPLDDKPIGELGSVEDWQIEWKWDGIRAQLIKRGSEVLIWSRGEELVGEQFPEVVEAAQTWPEHIVLDGELLAWDGDEPAPFSELQRRLGRKRVGPKLLKEVPVVFMAYDLLELNGRDVREQGTAERRMLLEQFAHEERDAFQLSPLVEVDSWEAVAAERKRSRELRVEGLMLKMKSASYFAGRKKGEWWKWKVDPYTVDAVMVYAQQGHGRRAGLYTDYTFSIWRDGELVPFAKAYSGLSDKEIREVDRWIRQHTLESHGPVRVVEPELVFEIAFEGIAESKRHKSGIAVRFPRIHRWRRDKPAAEADRLETVLALLNPAQ